MFFLLQTIELPPVISSPYILDFYFHVFHPGRELFTRFPLEMTS